jgi:hypothetical protein
VKSFTHHLFRLALVSSLFLARAPQAGAQGAPQPVEVEPVLSASSFDQVSDMQLLLTAYDLKRDAAGWKRTLSQISPSLLNRDFILDKQIQALLGDANELLGDIEQASTTVIKTPKASEVIALAFDLARLHEHIVNMSGSTVMADISKEELAATTASPNLRTNAIRWQQIMKDLANEVSPYREGLESYALGLGQTIDAAISK